MFGVAKNLGFQSQKSLSSYAATFASTSDATITLGSTIGTGDFCAELFARPQAGCLGGGYGNAFMYRWGTVDNDGVHSIQNGNHLYYDGTTGDHTYSSVTANVWQHFAVCRTSGNIEIYRNGSRVAAAFADAQSFGTTFHLGVGTFIGQIASVRVSDIARYTGASLTVPTAKFTSDGNTVHLSLQTASVDGSLSVAGTALTMGLGPF